MQHAGIELCSR